MNHKKKPKNVGTLCPIRPLWTELGTYTMTQMAGFTNPKLLQPYNCVAFREFESLNSCITL